MKRVTAKKHLGQHFLKDISIAEKITESLPSHLSNILEVGPGMGVLTQFLIQREPVNLKVVELDSESVSYLNQKYPSLRDRIIEDDFLTLNLKELYCSKFSLIGNFPYNISSQIFFKVYYNRDLIDYVVGMLQKEVAERISSKPGSKRYGILSVLLQAFFDIEYLFTVEENSFSPPPKVKSGVIRLKRNGETALNCNEKLFISVVKSSFNRRRKMLRNSLKPLVSDLKILDNSLFEKRPEQLSVEQFVLVTNIVERQMC
ncbi:16S rRNA (adenine(1518)-N(6)/adenine(1519)-N(6))-dimethyltransferase RsmA [Marinilabiliaceae bacterium ANBcel2]|nr:16S rRNA (adenine(1518)-N(6)/adenine(1519)-N(6))-dimethyltransferase RsmA [Marinilabiliaceae bacterium ANBcel2]